MDTHSKVRVFDRWFLYFFLYSLVITSLTKMVLLPLLFRGSLDPASRMLVGDASLFHGMAMNQLAEMEMHGIDVWKVRPLGHSAVGYASIIYFFFGTTPWALLPFNSFLHALAGRILASLFLLANAPQRIAIISAIPFLIMPTSLMWTSQLHKDVLMLPGLFAYFLGLTGLLSVQRKSSTRLSLGQRAICILVMFIGLCGVWIARPMMFYILVWVTIPCVLVPQVFLIRKRQHRLRAATTILVSGVCLFITNGIYSFDTNDAVYESKKDASEFMPPSQTDPQRMSRLDSPKTSSSQAVAVSPTRMESYLPRLVESTLRRIAERHNYYLRLYPDANSKIDPERELHTGSDVIYYIPRAFAVVLTWPSLIDVLNGKYGTGQIGLKLLSAIEIFVVDLILLSAVVCSVLARWKGRGSGVNSALLYSLAICLLLLLLISLLTPNVGTLVRARYGELSLVCGLGLCYFLMSLAPPSRSV